MLVYTVESAKIETILGLGCCSVVIVGLSSTWLYDTLGHGTALIGAVWTLNLGEFH